MVQQRTLAEKVSCTGLGLHTGEPVRLSLHPARVDTGIRLVRHTAQTQYETPARHASISATSYATTLGTGDASVSTVEHLLAALYALGVSNARIEVDGPEIPVMDGSAEPFVHLIHNAGLYEQHEPWVAMQIERKVTFSDGPRSISIEPAKHLRISYRVDFAHPAIGVQELQIDRLRPESFEAEVARARTFGFLDEVESLRRAGLARGGSLSNTVVLDSERVINPGGLRFRDEFVRHKVLDLIGDLSLLGVPIQGHVRVERGGHAMHHHLVEELLRQRDAWSLRGKTGEHASPLDPSSVKVSTP